MAWVEQTGQHSWRVRYRRTAGTTGSIPRFPTATADSRSTFEGWVVRWLPAQDLDPRTVDNYGCYLHGHLLPRFGTTPLADITALDIDLWTKAPTDAGYAPTTIASWTKLLSMILSDAIAQHLIPSNPVQRRSRGRRCRTLTSERVWATPEQVLRIANPAAALAGPPPAC